MARSVMLNPLFQSRRWLSSVENGLIGVWDLDPRVEIVHYSPQWKARLGFAEIDSADNTWSWRCRVHPDDLDRMADSLQSHLDGNALTYEAQFRLRINGSGYRTVISRGRVVSRDEQGNASQVVGTMVDLTGRPRASAMRGLAAEGPSRRIHLQRLPFHVILGAAQPSAGIDCSVVGLCTESQSANATESRRLTGMVDDLLETALREASKVPGVVQGR